MVSSPGTSEMVEKPRAVLGPFQPCLLNLGPRFKWLPPQLGPCHFEFSIVCSQSPRRGKEVQCFGSGFCEAGHTSALLLGRSSSIQGAERGEEVRARPGSRCARRTWPGAPAAAAHGTPTFSAQLILSLLQGFLDFTWAALLAFGENVEAGLAGELWLPFCASAI